MFGYLSYVGSLVVVDASGAEPRDRELSTRPVSLSERWASISRPSNGLHPIGFASWMFDSTAILVGVGVSFIVILALLAAMLKVIGPEEVGLVFIFGQYVTTLRPGLNFVRPFASVRRVTPGSGQNGVLGLKGQALADLDPDEPPGPIKVGDRQLVARPQQSIRAGGTLRVIHDLDLGTVMVAPDPSRFVRVRNP
jgi:hypothetical protein